MVDKNDENKKFIFENAQEILGVSETHGPMKKQRTPKGLYQSLKRRQTAADILFSKRMDIHMLLFAVCIIGAVLLLLSLLTFLLPNNINREISYIEQIAQDWETRPFVEIKVE